MANDKLDLVTLKRPRQDIPSASGKNKTEKDFFGEEYVGFKGIDAIEKLLIEKSGHVKNAFERPELGGIDLVWGDKDGGLMHTIARRDKRLIEGKGTISGVDMARKIPKIVDNGVFNIDVNDRPYIELDGFRVAIKPTYDGKKLNWVISAIEIEKPEKN